MKYSCVFNTKKNENEYEYENEKGSFESHSILLLSWMENSCRVKDWVFYYSKTDH